MNARNPLGHSGQRRLHEVVGSIETVLEGTRNILKWKKILKSSTPYIVFQYLVVRHNEHEIIEVKKIAKQIGVNRVVFKTAQIHEYANGNELIPQNEKYSRYKLDSDGKFILKNKLLNHCWKLWHSCVITWDGGIVPCCFDKDASYRMGTLKEKSFREIWNNAEYQSFRASLMKDRKEIEICKNCTEGTQVWA